MNPEQSAIRNLDSQTRMDKIRDTTNLLLPLHDKIAPVMKQIAIKPEQLADLYGEDMLRRDAEYVQTRNLQFKSGENQVVADGLTSGEVRKLAEVLEYQIIRGINIGNWIPFCSAIKTSEYDDIANGVDMVMEFQKSQQLGHLGLGIDISFSHNLHNKFQRIKNEIDAYDGARNRLGTVKYYQSHQTGIRGELSGLPRSVIALDIGVIEDLARTKGTGMANHMAKHTIITEMEQQLAVFADYAHKHNRRCYEQIMRAQNFMRVISEHTKSQQTLADSGYEKNRKVQEAIERGLDLFRN